MPALKRSINIRGPHFYAEDGMLMFVNHFDASTRDGPRAATKDDSLEHPEAWSKFVTEVEAAERAENTQAEMNKRDPRPNPLRPLVTFVDPPEGKPAPAPPSENQIKRDVARAAGVKA